MFQDFQNQGLIWFSIAAFKIHSIKFSFSQNFPQKHFKKRSNFDLFLLFHIIYLFSAQCCEQRRYGCCWSDHLVQISSNFLQKCWKLKFWKWWKVLLQDLSAGIKFWWSSIESFSIELWSISVLFSSTIFKILEVGLEIKKSKTSHLFSSETKSNFMSTLITAVSKLQSKAGEAKSWWLFFDALTFLLIVSAFLNNRSLFPALIQLFFFHN